MNSKEQTLTLRKKYIGPSLSLAYDDPLKIIKGNGQYLYDENGREYLDCVNNISHVGHCHPAVIQAAHERITGGNFIFSAISMLYQELLKMGLIFRDIFTGALWIILNGHSAMI